MTLAPFTDLYGKYWAIRPKISYPQKTDGSQFISLLPSQEFCLAKKSRWDPLTSCNTLHPLAQALFHFATGAIQSRYAAIKRGSTNVWEGSYDDKMLSQSQRIFCHDLV